MIWGIAGELDSRLQMKQLVRFRNVRMHFICVKNGWDWGWRPQDIVTVPIFVEPARQVFQRYLDSTHDFPTAFFAYNDIIAAGALKALAASPLRVPEDISISGIR